MRSACEKHVKKLLEILGTKVRVLHSRLFLAVGLGKSILVLNVFYHYSSTAVLSNSKEGFAEFFAFSPDLIIETKLDKGLII